MYKISGNVIKISRGDAATIDLVINNYVFAEDDDVTLAIFDAKSGFDDALVTLKASIDRESNIAVFNITEDTTSFADPVSKPKTYWYEVKLHGDQTIIGYDDNGAKEFIVYPAEVGDTSA